MNKPLFDEKDIKEIFFTNQSKSNGLKSIKEIKSHVNRPHHFRLSNPYVLAVIKYASIFFLIFIFSYSIINEQALIKKITYFWHPNPDTSSTAPTSSNSMISTPQSNISQLVIPKINVAAPISWNIDPDNANSYLEKGVVHYQHTALPGEIGNVFIFGHSSYYVWAKGDYKSVFALLDDLALGDNIYILYQGKQYVYRVDNKKTVSPNNLEVLNQGNSKTLSLMTCVPVGTNLFRLVVTAEEVGS